MTFSRGNTKAGKLDAVQVFEMRQKYATGLYTYARLSIEYGVSENTARSAVKGTSWQSVPMVEPASVVENAALRSMKKLDELMQEDRLPPASADALDAMERAVTSAPAPIVAPDVAARAAAYGVSSAPERGATAAEVGAGATTSKEEQTTPITPSEKANP